MRLRSLSLLILLALAGPSCGDDDDGGPADDGTADDGGDDDGSGASLLDRTAEALGGAAAIKAAGAESVEATGTRFDPGEARSTDEVALVGDFSYELTHRLAEDRARIDLAVSTDFLVPTELDYAQVIDGESGYLEGLADLFTGVTDARPLPSAQLTARLKHTRTTSLLQVVRGALDAPDKVTEEEDADLDGRAHHVLAVDSADHPPFRLYVDPDTSLPAALETLEHTPPLGDTTVLVRFDDYRAAGDLLLPHELVTTVDGLEVERQSRSRIEIDPDEPADLYAVADPLRQPLDEREGERGWRWTQYVQGFELLGLAFVIADEQAAPALQFAELATGVFHVQGASHQVLLVEMSDHLVLVDAPLNEAYADALHAALAERFPDKPVRTVIATHFHYDHVGGIRRFGADGGLTVVAGAASESFYEEVFADPYTVEPDLYAASPKPVTIQAISSSFSITDGERTVEVHPIESNHAGDMLVVYLPAEQVLFNSDLWSPQQGPLVAYFRVGATDLDAAGTALGLPPATLVAGSHSTGTGTLAELAELLAQPE